METHWLAARANCAPKLSPTLSTIYTHKPQWPTSEPDARQQSASKGNAPIFPLLRLNEQWRELPLSVSLSFSSCLPAAWHARPTKTKIILNFSFSLSLSLSARIHFSLARLSSA